jgi:hypothetical protein
MHVVTIGALRQIRFEPFSSGVLQIAAAFLVTVASYRASLRSHGFSRRFWFLTGIACTAWLAAQSLDVFNEFWLQSSDPNPNSLLLLFFFAVAPLAFTLFRWSPAETSEVRWIFVADAVQVAFLIGVTGFIYLKISDAASGMDLTIARLRILHWRNILLAGALIVRACYLRGEARRLFAILGASFASYTVGSLFANWALEVWQVGSGTWFDLAWSVPLLILAIHAAEWREASEKKVHSHVVDAELPLPGIISFAVISIALFGLKSHPLASTSIALMSFAVLMLRTYMLARSRRTAPGIAHLDFAAHLLDHVPICAACKRIRDERSGQWNPLEAHFGSRYGTRFTHGICDLCAEIWYPTQFDR